MSQMVGNYEILSELGRGGMGVVYKAFEPALNRAVALKMLNEGISHQPGLVERFYREARAMATLSDPNVVQIYAVGTHQGQPYFVMEYIDGESLGGRLKRERMSVRDARKLLAQAANGLQAAHERGLIHRDIKPGNLMLTQKGTVKVTDFGIALTEGTGERLTGTGGIIGTPGYLSPEACLGEPLDARTDIFALGVVFYEMLTGRLPFDDKSPYALMAAVVQAQIPDVAVLNSEVDPNTLAILTRMLARRPAERFQTCAEVANALESGASASPLPPPRNASLVPVGPPMMPPPSIQSIQAVTPPARLATPPVAYPPAGYQSPQPPMQGYGAPPQNYAPSPSVVIMPAQKSSLMPWALGGLGAVAVGGWLILAPASKTLITPDPIVAPTPERIPDPPSPDPPSPEPTPDPAPIPDPIPDPPPPNPERVLITNQNMQTLLGTYTGKIGKADFVLALQLEDAGSITGYNLADGKRRPLKGFVESFNEDIDADGDTWRVFNVVLEEPGDEDNDGKFRVEIKHTEKYVAGSGSWTSFTGTQQFDIAISNYNSKRD